VSRIRRVAAITGIRSEYDILFAVLKAIDAHPDLAVEVIVSGTHLSPQFGYTVQQIEADGFAIVQRIDSLLDANSAGSRLKSAALQQIGLVQALEHLQPDFLLVCGDREESISCALAGAYLNIPVAHLAGGDIVVGNVDDSVRHAVTKLAHLHFPFSVESARRIHRMGEEPWRICQTGNPGLDRFGWIPPLPRSELAARLDLPPGDDPLLLLIQHNISSEIGDAARQMEISLQAVAELGYPTLVGYPNSDAGSRDIIEVIRRYERSAANIRTYRNLPREEFLSVLRAASVLVGNSSLGILEAPFLKLPVINVGNRQKKRQHAENVLFVPHDKDRIVAAIRRALTDIDFRERVADCSCPFGDGRAGARIAAKLAETPVDNRLLVKDWAY
jgi:GDP/UDP-N,N'-diacetylbacillosamine 2-epimerase (hydrolysing)